MGIRYYAYPVPSEQTEAALASPREFMSADPLADAWGLVPSGDGVSERMGAKPVPEMLYLDKCWPLLQRLTGPQGGRDSISYLLFEGQVTWTPRGHIPWTKALSPEDVARIADDLAEFDEADVDRLIDGSDFDPRVRRDDRDYLLFHLRKAQEFTAMLRRTERGLVYEIG